MAPENPWFLIPHNDIPRMLERQHHPASGLPESRLKIGKIHSILYELRERQP
jgi:hypothetical protein